MKKDLLMLLAIIYCAFVADGQKIAQQIDALIEKAVRFDELPNYVSVCKINADDKIQVTLTDNQLFIQRNMLPPVALFTCKADTFFQKDDDIRVAFHCENGIIDTITISEGLNTRKGEKRKN